MIPLWLTRICIENQDKTDEEIGFIIADKLCEYLGRFNGNVISGFMQRFFKREQSYTCKYLCKKEGIGGQM